MDYVIFALMILALIGVMLLLRKWDKNTKNKHRKTAYSLLEMNDPDPREIKSTLRGLQMYGGRWRKDKEFSLLIKRLSDKLDSLGY